MRLEIHMSLVRHHENLIGIIISAWQYYSKRQQLRSALDEEIRGLLGPESLQLVGA